MFYGPISYARPFAPLSSFGDSRVEGAEEFAEERHFYGATSESSIVTGTDSFQYQPMTDGIEGAKLRGQKEGSPDLESHECDGINSKETTAKQGSAMAMICR